jgi:hypothetical protein
MLRLSDLFSNNKSKINNSGIGSVFLSPIWTAIITTLIVLLIVWFIEKDEIEPKYADTSIWTLLIKIGVWNLIAAASVQYIAYGAIEASIEDKYINKNQREIVYNANNSEAKEGAIAPE